MISPSIRETLNWLRQQELPPLPVAPAHDPEQYPACDRKGNIKRDPNGRVMPAFTGKNPSFLDAEGVPHLIRHTQYQQRLPSDQELQMWFTNPANGIGTLGGWSNVVWIDVDVKRFDSEADCDARMGHWLNQYPILQHTFTERTQSGGWRLAVRVGEKSFTNFSLDGCGGKHVGEVLGQGRFTVLAPTIGPSGNAYVNLQRVLPVWVERLEAIGLYPVSRRRERVELPKQRSQIQTHPVQLGTLRLADLATAKAQAVLYGASLLESRSHSLSYALREFYGWENWCADNEVPISGTAEELARAAGAALGLECDRTERIIQSVGDPGACVPAVVFAGGDVSAWRRIGMLNRQVYCSHCPPSVQQVLERTLRKGFNQTCQHTSPTKLQQIEKVKLDFQCSHHQLSNAVLSSSQIRETIKYAFYILEHAGNSEQGDNELSPSIRGKIYQVDYNQDSLKIRANHRGVILLTQGNEIISTKLMTTDLVRFRYAALRIQARTTVLQEKGYAQSRKNEIVQE